MKNLRRDFFYNIAEFEIYNILKGNKILKRKNTLAISWAILNA